MSSFNPNYNRLQPFEWQQRALQKATDNNSSFLPIGGLILGIAAASATGFAPTGVLIFGWAVYEAFQRNRRMSRNEVAITQYGCVAHALSEDDFRDFLAQCGHDEVIKQLHWAKQNKYPLSEVAQDYLETQPLTPAPAFIGQDTKLNALPVDAMPVAEFQEITPDEIPYPNSHVSQSQSETRTEIVSFQQETPDLPTVLARSMKNALIIGVPGAGKGIFVSNALEAVKNNPQKVTVFYLDPKGDTNESGYFSGRVDKLYRADVINQSPEEIYEWVVASLDSFDSTHVDGIKLLVFDELTAIAGILKTVKGATQWLKSRITSYSSSGSSRGIILWGIAQNAHLANLGLDGGTRSIFNPVFLISGDHVTASADILRSGMIPEEKKLDPDSIVRLCKKSEVNRAIFFGPLNAWFPALRMENYSGFDRDTRTFLPGFEPPKQDKLASDFKAIASLEEALRSDSPTIVDSKLSAPALMLLEYFNNASKKEPKSIRDLKQSNKLRDLEPRDLLLALHELVKGGELVFDIEGNYLKSDWQ